MPSFAIVGGGRAGWSFHRALTTSGWVGDEPHGRHDDLNGLAERSDIIILAVPDDRIAEVATTITPGQASVLHLSGVKTLEVLLPHERRGSVHPLMSLPDPETGAQRLRAGTVFAVAGDPSATDVVEALGGHVVAIDEDLRPLYHATAAIAANHLVALCGQVERLASEVGVPVAAYWELMATTLDNVARAGPAASLTGPAARGDESTLAKHLEALPAREHELYLALAREASRLAGRPPGPAITPSPAVHDQRRRGPEGTAHEHDPDGVTPHDGGAERHSPGGT